MFLYIRFQASDIIELHSEVCTTMSGTNLQLSLDGVSETKSTNTSLDVYSASFNNCRTVYPLQIVRPIVKDQVNNRMYLESLLQELKANQCHITDFIADNPKRSFVRDSIAHAGKYACALKL